MQEFGKKNLPFFKVLYNLQIIGLSETWLSKSITDHEILPQAYTIYRKDRGTRGGGVLLAINSNLPSRQIPSPENLCVSVSLSNTDVTFCMVYAPPNAAAIYYSDLSNYLTTIAVSPNPVFIVGDFNFADID